MSYLSYINKWLDAWVKNAGATANIIKLDNAKFQSWLESASVAHKNWVVQNNFTAKSGEFILLPESNGELQTVLFGIDQDDPFSLARLAGKLPKGIYNVDGLTDLEALGWLLDQYRFDHYKKVNTMQAKLLLPENFDFITNSAFATAILWGRDLINAPAEDLNPQKLAQEALALANLHNAKIEVIDDQEILKKDFPAVYAVGKAANYTSRLIDLNWGKGDFAVTLVGKGVCFDSGGLNIKPTSGMLTMKKDMGGAAHVLALAHVIMSLDLPITLRVIVPAVENAISGCAYRPGDIVTTRSKKTVEITNTDAEGRMILSDALTLAQEKPVDLLIDFATLTGAARVALGTDLPGFFSTNEALSQKLMSCGRDAHDPVWPLPLYKPYKSLMESDIADLKNAASGGYGGAITAALFLQEFVKDGQDWIHFDLMAANTKAQPGKPVGGEIMALRAMIMSISSL